jgi:hypothetical protein
MNNRLTFLFALVYAFCVYAALAKAYWPDRVGDMRETGISGSGVLPLGTTCLKFNGATYEQICSPADGTLYAADSTGAYRLYIDTKAGGNAIYGRAQLTDVAAKPILITPNRVFPGVAAANTTGANLIAAPGGGLTQITGVTRAGTGGDTLTFVVQNNDGTTSTVVLTEGAGAGQWSCVLAASDGECVDNIATLINATATLNTRVLVTHTTGQETLALTTVPGTSWDIKLTPSDTTNIVRTRGIDGCMQLGASVFLRSGAVSSGSLELSSSCGGAGSPFYSGNLYAAYGSFVSASGVDVTSISTAGSAGVSLAVAKGAKSLSTLKQATVTFAGGGWL